ncbi:MAG: c-type cytochrome [Caulobacterales bacterium]
MRVPALLILSAATLALAACGPRKAEPGASLSWAYPQAAKPPPSPRFPGGPLHVPGSALSFTAAQVGDDRNPVDWFPAEHPAPPMVVAHEREGGPTPCAECHLYNGRGFIAAADLAGLSAPYIVQQVQAFRSGRRQSAQHDRFDTNEMIKVSAKISDHDLAEAAAYFSSLPRAPSVRVVETDTVPATKPYLYGWLEIVPNGGTEPIKGQIIEVSEDMSRMYLADPHVGLVDYVPPGAVKRGEALVRSGGRNGQPCAACHGSEWKGVGDTPPLAGRAASYLARMLWDIKTGARRGPDVAAMQAPAKALNEVDITDVAAYLASRKP